LKLIQRDIEDGIELDEHPGIVFHSGRRGVAPFGGRPDVWEIEAGHHSFEDMQNCGLARPAGERARDGVEIGTEPAEPRSTSGSDETSKRRRAHRARQAAYPDASAEKSTEFQLAEHADRSRAGCGRSLGSS
jgi:hypothetical protein